MLNPIRDLLDPSFPLGNYVWFDLSFPDKSRQFVIDEGRQALALLVIRDIVLILNAECGVNQSDCERGELVGKGRARVVMGRTDDVDILPDCFDFVGCTIEDNNLAFTLCQDAYSKSMCFMERDCVEGKVNAIASGFLQLLNRVGVLVLYQEGREQLANSKMRSLSWSTNIKDNICPEILDEFVVVRRRDCGHLVTREFCKLDRILANRRRPSINEKPRASGGILVTGLRKLQGPRSI